MTGRQLYNLATRLFPICRSITGPGVRETLDLLREYISLTIHSVPSGTKVCDWIVPEEWTPRAAWIADTRGKKVLDFSEHNLHLLQYSQAFHGRISREELEAHLFTLPELPELIPYKTSYYQKQWGFCLSDTLKKTLTDSEYDINIDVSHEPGTLNYGELLIPGITNKEILISTHICHPSMANDNLSGIVVAVACALGCAQIKSHYSIRFIFVPGTIGAITWLAKNPDCSNFVDHGLVLTGLGAGEQFHYKQSRSENAVIDHMMSNIFREFGLPYTVHPFSPYGYDERQYNSPGFALPVGCLTRLPHGSYPEYHTSADDLSFIRSEILESSFILVSKILQRLAQNRCYQNLFPYGEPQLGQRKLYASSPEENMATLWVLNLSDGKNSLLDISNRSGITYETICLAAENLLKKQVIQAV